ncbi:hypothetical protein EYF80_037888 [Liparis tanakae]|uniref:Uncharacterized protein n=1 Tax=Liparis tanakae TaxID=230148 RepID=A0A4Z2GEI1_9TELE|nr:hypothetical protein EYF80_037888 [Liparis tanakae]
MSELRRTVSDAADRQGTGAIAGRGGHVGSSGEWTQSGVDRRGEPEGLRRSYLLPILLDWYAISR